MPILRGVAAVSFDFFDTLATHRHGRGRGALLAEYFRAQGWASEPWEHAVLYDVFAAHGEEFAPTLLGEDLRAFCCRVARTLFRRLQVDVDPSFADEHAIELWRLLGPEHLASFPESTAALRRLRAGGYRLAIISNWQRGLRAFCQALGFGTEIEVVVTSAEVGAAKPDARIFAEACGRLGLPPERVLHVGDSETEDIRGAREAGLQALWLRRGKVGSGTPGEIRSLDELAAYLPAVAGRPWR